MYSRNSPASRYIIYNLFIFFIRLRFMMISNIYINENVIQKWPSSVWHISFKNDYTDGPILTRLTVGAAQLECKFYRCTEELF